MKDPWFNLNTRHNLILRPAVQAVDIKDCTKGPQRKDYLRIRHNGHKVFMVLAKKEQEQGVKLKYFNAVYQEFQRKEKKKG